MVEGFFPPLYIPCSSKFDGLKKYLKEKSVISVPLGVWHGLIALGSRIFGDSYTNVCPSSGLRAARSVIHVCLHQTLWKC